MSDFARRLFRPLLYLSYLAAATLVIIYAVWWRPFVSELRDRHQPETERLESVRHVGKDLINQLGFLRTRKQSSFVQFSKEKPAKTRRVCAFGDSYTYGDEVAEAHDYPSVLQNLLRLRGHRDLEVLNFGSSAFGFHQAYLVWERLGTEFACDYILLGPECFQEDRDTRFNHTNLDQPYYLHSRFVLRGDDVVRVDVAGDTHQERFRGYFSFFPRWDYLRYDRNPPPVLLSMLPEDRAIANPLYYHPGSEKDEAIKTYRRLLRRITASAATVVLAHARDEIVEIGLSLGAPNLIGAPIWREKRFPYLARKGHNSAMGNRVVAEQYFEHVVAEGSGSFEVLKISDPSPAGVSGVSEAARAISSYERIEVRAGAHPLAFFFSTERRKDWSHLQEDEVGSLVAIKDPETSLVDAFFVPLEGVPAENAEAQLLIKADDGKQAHSLGRIRWLDPRLRIGYVDVPGLSYRKRWKSNRIFFGGNDAIPIEPLLQEDGRFYIHVAGERIAKGRRSGGRLKFEPKDVVFYELRAAEGHDADVERLAPAGDLELVVRDREAGELRVPIGSWRKQTVAVPGSRSG